MKYKILESSYYNEFGETKCKHYWIKEKRRFLGIGYWKTVTHPSYDGFTPTLFDSEGEAVEFIRDVLERKKFKGGWEEKVVNRF